MGCVLVPPPKRSSKRFAQTTSRWTKRSAPFVRSGLPLQTLTGDRSQLEFPSPLKTP